MTRSTRSSLLKAMADPDRQDAAWAEFDAEYTPRIRAWLRSGGVKSHAEADDLIQDIKTRLFEQFKNGFVYDPRQSFRAYLANLVRWMRFDAYTRWHRQVNAAGGTTAGEHLAAVPDPAAAPQSPGFDADDLHTLLQQARSLVGDRLMPVTWEAFELYVVRGMTPEEVEKQLGISLASVYTAKSRVLGLLRDLARQTLED